MKANELRIGNYHLYRIRDKFDERKEWDEVYTIDAQDLVLLSKYENKDYKPVPLTEEWLLNFGFVKTSLHYFKYNSIIITIEDNGFQCLLGFQCVNLKYVHQLQNLYFALTDQELTYGK